MSASKHTPGPWDVEVIEDILTNSPEWVDASDERIAADARLIAAAPDMYEALKQLLKDIDPVYEVDNGIVLRYACIYCRLEPAKRNEIKHDEGCGFGAAEKALAKAEGKE